MGSCLPCGPWAAQEPEPEPVQLAALEARVAQLATLEARVAQLEAGPLGAAQGIALGNRLARLEAQPPWQFRAAEFAAELRSHDQRLMVGEDCAEELFRRVDNLVQLGDRLAQRVADIELPEQA